MLYLSTGWICTYGENSNRNLKILKGLDRCLFKFRSVFEVIQICRHMYDTDSKRFEVFQILSLTAAARLCPNVFSEYRRSMQDLITITMVIRFVYESIVNLTLSYIWVEIVVLFFNYFVKEQSFRLAKRIPADDRWWLRCFVFVLASSRDCSTVVTDRYQKW